MFKGFLSIYTKEIRGYFFSLIAYIFLALYILIPNLFFFALGGIFRENSASMRFYFTYFLPITYIFFIPGLTMGVWADEINQGTLELLYTLPISNFEILLGKFFSSLTLVLIALISTLIIPILVQATGLGRFDWGQIFTQYFGAVLMAAAYISISFFFSGLTKKQINSFLLSATFLLIFTLSGYLTSIIIFPDSLTWLNNLLNELSLFSHFKNFAKGVIDTRDFFYYIIVAAIFLYCNIHTLNSKKWG